MYPTDPPDAPETQQGYTGYHNDGVFDRGDAWWGEQGQPVEADSAAQSVMRRERRHLVVNLTLFMSCVPHSLLFGPSSTIRRCGRDSTLQ